MNRDETDVTLDRSQLERAVPSDMRTLSLVVIDGDKVENFALSAGSVLTIGRADTNHVVIDHALMSREHARVFVGDTVTVEDLGSRNGTLLTKVKLPANTPTTIAPGQVFEVGATLCVLQRATPDMRPQRLTTHGYFELQLERRCRTGRRDGEPFAVLRLETTNAVSPTEMQAVLRDILDSDDVAGAYAPGEYELLLNKADERRVDRIKGELEQALGDGVRHIGVARFPRDGQTPDQLVELAAQRGGSRSDDDMVIGAPAMVDLYRIGDRVAKGNISVLLLGETGVGKEVFAEALHRASPRHDKSFVRLNCAALAESLLESELFGHEKGAFTGADHKKIGLLESANGGTVMLDELGEMPLGTQAKLLRVLEQREVTPVGGVRPVPIDVRFISATNRDLEQEVTAGRFRQDVFFRLNGVTLSIPPLRERRPEIEPLARRFVIRAAAELGFQPPEIAAEAFELLLGHAWPGNIRELKNTMERAVLLCMDETIDVEHLPHEKMLLPWDGPSDAPSGASAPVGDDERQRIIDALDRCAGNQTRAAKMLGIGRRTLTRKLTRYGIRRPRS